MPKFGPVELVLIMVIVTMLFGVGKLPEVFGAVGRGVREFRNASSEAEKEEVTSAPVRTQAVAEETPAETNTLVHDTRVS